jgi:hypothetical protein
MSEADKMKIKRRQFLTFMGAATAISACAAPKQETRSIPPQALAFKPVKLPLPLDLADAATAPQPDAYLTYEVIDDLVLPEGYTYDLIAAWGDSMGQSRYGYNNDYVSYVATGDNQGILTINFEYISAQTWMQTYEQVIGQALPLKAVQTALANRNSQINAFALPDTDPLKAQIVTIAKAGLTDQGIGVLSVQRRPDGTWKRTQTQVDRRITGISGLEDQRYLKATGPAVAVFKKANKQGYDDGLGDRIIGTFANCAGGTTPWGTVLSAEENFQDQVPEAVKADGSALDPAEIPFELSEGGFSGQGNPLGLAGNKYGWMVEVDPSNPEDYGTKHTWLGRYRHEAVAFFAEAGKKLAVYSGCDRRAGHLYKFVSQGKINRVTDKANSKLMTEGMLYGAKFNPDGTGQWLALNPNTPVDPVLPSQVLGEDGVGVVLFPNPDRTQGGVVQSKDDGAAQALTQQFKTLGDLYEGNPTEKQGAILIDAHYAANAAGVTCTARPEDTEFDANRRILYIAFTSGSPDPEEGGPDKAIFKGPQGETPYELGWIMKIVEDNQDPGAASFRWEMLALGGEPALGGMGFANPDNLAIDGKGNVWMVTDMSTDKHNQEVPSRSKDGKPLDSSKLRGLFGNNSAWVIPTTGENAGKAYPFAIGPTECELCGLYLTPDQTTLFLTPQHPGELHGIRQEMAKEVRQFAMQTPDGQTFMQTRTVPLGSNWPGKSPTDPPKPAIVAVRRLDGGSLA